MSDPWVGGIGTWALEAERAEEEERERAASEAFVSGEPAQSFPSLKEANVTRPKKKPVKLSLSQFNAGAYPAPSGVGRPSSGPKGLTPDEMLRLPTAPRQRSSEGLEHGTLGGGFRSYNSGGGGQRDFPSRRPEDRDSLWGGGGRRQYGGSFDEEERRGVLGSKDSYFDQPSRADEVDNWAAAKKANSLSMDSGRRGRYSLLEGGGLSRADNVGSWVLGKKQAPVPTYPSLSSGFRDSSDPSDSNRWVKEGSGAPAPSNGAGERPRLVLDQPKGAAEGPARTRPSPFGAARPREEVLREKGLDWRKLDSDIESKKSSGPTSSHSSRPSSVQSSRPSTPASQASGGEGAYRPLAKVNPFGDAKPREVLLEERGKDWRKIDFELEHRSVDRLETEEEKLLKEDIHYLKNVLAKEIEPNLSGSSSETSSETLVALREQILQRENQLELLIRDMDDKVRFGQRATTGIRTGSGTGRGTVSADLPLFGMSEKLRSIEFMERPRSRGGILDGRSVPIDERQGSRGRRKSDFFGHASMQRSKSRDGW